MKELSTLKVDYSIPSYSANGDLILEGCFVEIAWDSTTITKNRVRKTDTGKLCIIVPVYGHGLELELEELPKSVRLRVDI